MEEWKTYKLEDLCKRICSGGTPKSTCEEFYGGTIPWLNTKEVNFNRIYETESTITQTGYNNSSAKWVDANSIIVAMYGNTAGKVALAKIPLTTNQACCNLTIDELKADYRYLFYYLLSQYDIIKSKANGAAQQNLNAQQIKDLLIPLPSLETQRVISDILTALDDKIELNNRINHNLEEQAQALYKSWFVDFEPFKDGKFVESELGMIPEGWSTSTIQALSDRIASGGTPKSTNISFYDGPVKWFTTKELKDGFLFDSEKHISKNAVESSATKIFPMGTVLMAIYASPTVGRLGILTSESSFNQASVAILPKHNIGSEYIFLHLLSERDRLNNLASGAAQQNLNVGIVKNYPVLYPTPDVLISFNSITKQLFSKIRNNSSENCCLIEMRDSLLSKLMSGELKINEIDC